MKKLFLLLAVSIGSAVLVSTAASAQGNEKVVTGSVNYLISSETQILDEYISDQMFSGTSMVTGWNIKLGALYRKHDNLSWDLYFKSFGSNNSTILDPAYSQSLTFNDYNVGYGTYYHWNIGKKLMIKAGGMFDLYGASKKAIPDGVNNAMNMEGQIMVKAHGAIKYGWDFKKWALDLHARVSLPVFGIMTADHPSEPALALIGNDHNILDPAYRHIFLASYHNYMSLDYALGMDFVLKPCTLTLGFGSTSKWWNVYDVQNIRKISYLTLGVSFDLVGLSKFKSSNKNF